MFSDVVRSEFAGTGSADGGDGDSAATSISCTRGVQNRFAYRRTDFMRCVKYSVVVSVAVCRQGKRDEKA